MRPWPSFPEWYHPSLPACGRQTQNISAGAGLLANERLAWAPLAFPPVSSSGCSRSQPRPRPAATAVLTASPVAGSNSRCFCVPRSPLT